MYKVWVLPCNETKWCSNLMEYETQQEAKEAAIDLFGRWLGITHWAILPLDVANRGYLASDIIDKHSVERN